MTAYPDDSAPSQRQQRIKWLAEAISSNDSKVVEALLCVDYSLGHATTVDNISLKALASALKDVTVLGLLQQAAVAEETIAAHLEEPGVPAPQVAFAILHDVPAWPRDEQIDSPDGSPRRDHLTHFLRHLSPARRHR